MKLSSMPLAMQQQHGALHREHVTGKQPRVYESKIVHLEYHTPEKTDVSCIWVVTIGKAILQHSILSISVIQSCNAATATLSKINLHGYMYCQI